MITRPQKAPSEQITNEELELLEYPVYGSVKLDGYRCETEDGAYTSSMKLVSNRHTQAILSKRIYNGLEGELIVGAPNDLNAFNNTTGPIRKADGEPDFTFYVFDRHDKPHAIYKERLEVLVDHCRDLPHVVLINQEILNSPEEVRAYEQWCVEAGFEGAMIRSMNGMYKEGRCTLNEKNIFKRKPTEDDEGVIIGFEEQMQNNNKKSKNEMGLTTRTDHKGNKTGKGTLGVLILDSKLWVEPVRVGTGKGLTKKLRQYIWDHKSEFLGQPVTYKYQKHGSIDAPRCAIYKGLRDRADMTDF